MGLDNGIRIENFNEMNIKYPRYINLHWDRDPSLICHWRKCWGIRNSILYIVGYDPKNEEYEYSLKLEDISDIIKTLKYFSNKSTWENSGQSIWEWRVIKGTLKDQIRNLKWLKRYWKRHPNLKVIFYDSY